jgi:hypothetical protein
LYFVRQSKEEEVTNFIERLLMMITILMMMMITKNFPGEKDIDLALIDDAETFCNGFENSYNAIFVQGCHIPRVPRAPGQPTIPETAERIQYRILIRDLWEILGLLFDMRTEL